MVYDRLKSRKSISNLMQEGKRKHFSCLLFVYQKKEGQKPLQIAFSVPKRLIKMAVSRNRIKRQLRAACYENLKNESLLGWNIMLIYRSGEQANYEKLQGAIAQFLKYLRTEEEHG